MLKTGDGDLIELNADLCVSVLMALRLGDRSDRTIEPMLSCGYCHAIPYEYRLPAT